MAELVATGLRRERMAVDAALDGRDGLHRAVRGALPYATAKAAMMTAIFWSFPFMSRPAPGRPGAG